MSNTLNRKIHIKRDAEEDCKSQKQIDRWISFILILVIILVPLLIGGHITEVVSPIISNMDQLVSGQKIDIFTYYKLLALIPLTILAVGMFLYKLFFLDYRLPKRPILWFFAIFVLSIIIATMFSETKTIALYGQYNRSDGGLSYICYVLLMFVAMHITYPNRIVEYVLYAFYPLVIINFILITMNFTGHDALKYDIIINALTIFAPGIEFGEGSNLLGTLNHGNYISGMFSIVTIMYIAWVVIDMNNLRRLVNFVILLLSVSTMLMALSTSGFLTLICVTPFILWLAIKSVNKKMALISIVIFCAFTAGILHVLSLHNSKVWDESVGFFISDNPYIDEPQVTYDNNQKWNPQLFIETKAYAADSAFVLPTLPESGVGPGSGRIFIWENTIKLTLERPLFGYGLDTLMYNFPQGHIDLRANLETGSVIIDKPHNVYIGVLYGTGVIGFIGFMGIVILSVLASLKGIFRFKESSGIVVILAITWLAYLFQSLFNDTLPGTATPLWIIAGIMMGLLYKQKNK
ncbi:O-antigen ligase family protein [Psychrobacillus sp. FSL H8-0510]|uniref:O-antigen ligase family protein n=1 Tax=Psychrobacillus sp. FSL H8-0510 TaxID=2921394 RepID=UPI0030F5BF2B